MNFLDKGLMESKNATKFRINSTASWRESLTVKEDKTSLDEQYRPDCTESSVRKVMVCSYPLSQPFPYAEILIRGTFLKDGFLPAFWGPTLRGGLGYHLKKTVCHVKQGSCQSCIVQKSCAYSYVFEGVAPDNREFMRLYPNIPQPFVLITDMGCDSGIKAEQRFQFGMRLFGRAIELFPYIVYSFLEIAKEGLGKDRIPYRIDSIIQPAFSNAVYRDGNPCLGALKRELVDSFQPVSDKKLVVEFLTPTKMQVGGKESEHITFSDLIRSALRRISILDYFYGSQSDPQPTHFTFLDDLDSVKTFSDDTKVYEVNRFSGRQQKKMTLKGILGKMTFTGDWHKYSPILELVRICHVGKATSFGFGQIKLSQE